MRADQTYRVIQWATGNVGSRALRSVIEHPQLELAGLYVSSPDKVGRDAGDLAGSGTETGIRATSDVDALIATPADCVLYMRQGTDIDEVCRILESGKNIVTTRGDFHHPRTMDAGVRERVEAACAKGGTSLYGTGSSPGFVTEALAIPLLSLQRRHDLLTINEYADVSSRNSPELLFTIMGFGEPMAPFHQTRAEHLKQDFGSSLGQIADAIGLHCDVFTAEGELAAARDDIQIAAGLVQKGTVAAQRITVTGMRGDRAVLRFRAHWYVTTGIDEDWGLRESGWKIITAGDTPVEVDITYPVHPNDYAAFTPGLTAHRPVNAIPMVCRAEPGIRTTADLEQVIPTFT